MSDEPTPRAWPRPMRTSDELKELARQVLQNEVYLATADEAEKIDNAFGMMIALCAGSISEDEIKQVVALTAPMSSASPMSVNGYPSFFSMGFIYRDEWATFAEHINVMGAALGLWPADDQEATK